MARLVAIDADQRRLMWTLAALLAMLMPALNHIRPWAAVLIGLLIIWRLANAWFDLPLPGRPSRILLTLAALAGIWLSYGTLLGIVAGSALLIVMAGLKLIECRAPRDYFLLLVIALFIGLSDFLYAPRIGLAFYMLPALWLTVTAFVIVGHGNHVPSGRQAGRIAMSLLLPALPVAAILFFIFPRMPGPIWKLPSQGMASSGIGDSMAPGTISRLAKSNRIAFRVRFQGSPPAKSYWRGPVLHQFAGGVWTRGPHGFDPASIQMTGKRLSYSILLRPQNHRWLYTLAIAANWPTKARLAGDYTLYAAKPVTERRQYHVVSYPDARYGLELPAANRKRDLELPENGNPRARTLAHRWRRTLDSPRAIVQKALGRFANGDYFYTLNPPKLGKNGIDQFLFSTRRGFCGHYASAFAFVMRAAGIPAHVVTGYRGSEVNPVDGWRTVRDSRAHAWVEVWLAGTGWKRIDPTAAVPGDHVEPGAAAVFSATAGTANGDVPLLRHFEYALSAANTFWNRWVMGYGPTLQQAAFATFGIDYGNWLSVAMTVLVAFAMIFAIIGGWFGWRAWLRRGEPVIRLYAGFCRKLEHVGLRRRRSEGPLDFAHRAKNRRPDCTETIETVTRLYVALRYEMHPPGDALRRLATAVANFQPERRI